MCSNAFSMNDYCILYSILLAFVPTKVSDGRKVDIWSYNGPTSSWIHGLIRSALRSLYVQSWTEWQTCCMTISGWRHQTETFSALLALCEGNSQVTVEFPSQRPVTRGFYIFLDLHLKKRLSRPSRRRWFETPFRAVWRHCNGTHRHIARRI